MKRLLNVDLETKINGILLGVISLLILSLSAFYLYHSGQEYFDNAKRITLQSAKTISFLPGISNQEDLEEQKQIDSMMNQYVYDNDIDFIILQKTNGEILYHPDVNEVGKVGSQIEAAKATVFGAYYVRDEEVLGKDAFVAYAPIYAGQEVREIVGVVKVGYYKSKIMADIYSKLTQLLVIVIVFIFISIFISRWFANYIKSETLGYEPREITTILKNRENIFSALNEGIISTNLEGKIEYRNEAANRFLKLSPMETDINIDKFLDATILETVKSAQKADKIRYLETTYAEKEFIVIINNLYERGELKGYVFILRDMTEKMELTNKLQVVESLFDDLRAQSHEYKNKLHLISGLLELKKYQAIRDVLTEEMEDIDHYQRNLLNIEEDRIKALLLAKINSANEKQVKLEILEDSHMDIVVSKRFLNALLTIISNLLDNAIEAVSNQENRKVKVYIGHYEDWLEIMVQDFGEQIIDTELIFEKGYSTKKNGINKGYGLYNVKTNVELLNGFMDVFSNEHKTIFTVEIPIYKRGANQ